MIAFDRTLSTGHFRPDTFDRTLSTGHFRPDTFDRTLSTGGNGEMATSQAAKFTYDIPSSTSLGLPLSPLANQGHVGSRRLSKVSFVAIPVGLFLVVTAALKLWHFLAGASELTPAWLDPVMVLYEAALGFGLLFARRPARLWLVTVATFAVFVGFNLRAIWIGQASCGCFGAVTVSPWGALVLDLGVLALLATWVWLDRETRILRTSARGTVGFLLGFGLAVAIMFGVVSIGFGSVAGARAYLRRDELYLDPPVVDLGRVPAGEASERVISVYNPGSSDVRVVGGTASCACTLIQDLPATIPPGQSRTLRVSVKAPTSAGAFQVRAVLWTDSSTNQTAPVLLRGRSVGP
jgi:hypothetical protein